MDAVPISELIALAEEGLTHREIGGRLSLSKSAVQKRLRRYRDGVEKRAKAAGVDTVTQSEMERQAMTLGIEPKNVAHYWAKTRENADGNAFSLFVRQPAVDWDELRSELVAEMDGHAPRYDRLTRERLTDGHCLVVDPADVHIGQLSDKLEVGEAYDANIAVERALAGVNGVLQKTQGFAIDKIVFVAGNDILHTDNVNQRTTAGTQLQTSVTWHRAFTMARRLYVEIIEALLAVADVHYVHIPSNHDRISGQFLSHVIEAWFRQCPNVTFDVSPSSRKYVRYGQNLMGFTHGDGAKAEKLAMLMAHEAKVEWAETKFWYVYSHHIHSKRAQDFGGVAFETLRSPSAASSWAHSQGFQHSQKAVEGFLHSKDNGQIARISHFF